MFLLNGLFSRSSGVRLVEPGPGRKDIECMLAAAARAPDHGQLRPWRFRVLEGDARTVLADALADFAQRANPAALPEQLAAARDKALRAPVIVIVSARITRGHKVPEIEQLLAVGAAVQNLLLAAQALAFGAVWKTGAAAHDPGVKRALGLEADDHIVAFVHLGTAQAVAPVRAVNLEGCVRWQ